jgi:hypothetical protein
MGCPTESGEAADLQQRRDRRDPRPPRDPDGDHVIRSPANGNGLSMVVVATATQLPAGTLFEATFCGASVRLVSMSPKVNVAVETPGAPASPFGPAGPAGPCRFQSRAGSTVALQFVTLRSITRSVPPDLE